MTAGNYSSPYPCRFPNSGKVAACTAINDWSRYRFKDTESVCEINVTDALICEDVRCAVKRSSCNFIHDARVLRGKRADQALPVWGRRALLLSRYTVLRGL